MTLKTQERAAAGERLLVFSYGTAMAAGHKGETLGEMVAQAGLQAQAGGRS